RRIQEEEAWLKVISPMFIAYMRCKALTLEWGHLTDWDTDWKIDCLCPESGKRKRYIDCIDLLTRRKKLITFCDCEPDQVRLIWEGYIGGTPTYPQTAFSLRLLRFFDILWKFCSIRYQPFMEALEEYLNAANPIITRENSNEPRNWRRPFTAAVDAYRHMLRLESELAIRAMKLNSIDKLAANCPRCFGEHYPNHRKEEPDFIVCMDGNFQQRRHLLASCEPAGLPHTNPALFIHPSQVEAWNPRGQWITEGDGNDDVCTSMHTAADDTRGATTWQGCDDTGLLAMVCRHDHLLAFVNIVQSGEKAYFSHAMIDWLLKNLASGSFPDDPRIGILYDIGCNIEKGLIRVSF
ncbi:hypothetical protein DFH28DRAFT_1161825, partial [Melampsora americana]